MRCENLSIENPKPSELPAIQASRTRKPVTASPPQTLATSCSGYAWSYLARCLRNSPVRFNGAVTDESGGAIPNATFFSKTSHKLPLLMAL